VSAKYTKNRTKVLGILPVIFL